MGASALEQLIEAVRRRRIQGLVLDQSTFALSLALGAAILLLLTGTQILNWYWPVAIGIAAGAFGAWRIRQRLPDPYGIAQSIDRKLGFHDALSTAWHFRNTSIDVFSEEVKGSQRQRAETLARQADPAVAEPLRIPRSARWCVLLASAALALFGVRYGVQKSLDLSRPLVAFNLDPFSTGETRELAKNKMPAAPPIEEFLKSVSVQPPETKEEGLDAAPDSALGVVDIPDVNATNSEQPSAKTGEKGASAGDQQEGVESGEPGEGATGDSPAPENKTGETGGQQKSDGDQKASNQQQAGDNSSLLDKMRDALASMMNKLNVQQKQGEGQQQAAKNQNQGQPSANARQQPAKQGMQGKGQPNADQQQAANQSGQEQDMQESDPSQAAQGKPGERNSAQQAANQENKSGMGKQDGSKDVKMAEQMAAMGKISEIIGKRNERLKGEIMIEVNSSKQALRTQYSQRAAQHADMGGEIHRDEVPLAFQSYVQQYFEEIRKAPLPAPRPPAKAPAPPAETP